MLAVAITAGVLIGLSLGALGGGGSILTVPALVYLLHQSPHAATTGSLVIVGISALAGAVVAWRGGRVRLAQGVTFGLLGLGGSFVGSRLSASVDPDVLLTAFAALMFLAAAAMLRRCRAPASVADPDSSSAAPGVPPAPGRAVVTVAATPRVAIAASRPQPDLRRAATTVAAATAVGLLTGFFGVGGGFVIVPALVLALGFDMPVAVGTSLLVITINSASALVSRLGVHTHLDWPMLGLFTLAAIAGSIAGNRVASRVNASKLTMSFVVLLLAVAAYTAVRSIPPLF